MNDKVNSSESNISSVTLEEALLSVPYPIVKFEGLDLKVTYANNALLELWSKDKSILGKTFIEILPELADQPFPALLRRVIETGETHTDSEAIVYIEKNGVLEAKYFDYSYTAVKNTRGENTGVIVICKDVTEQFLAKQKLDESESRFREMVLQAPFSISILQGPEFIIETANSRNLDISGKTTDILGKRFVDVYPELSEQGLANLLENVYKTGEPFLGNELPIQLLKDGSLTPGYFNFVFQPMLKDNRVTSIMTVGYEVTVLVLSRKIAEKKKELLEYLNRAGEELALTLDTKSALVKISDLIVPKFAHWFTINVLNGENLDLLIINNKDEEYVKWAREFRLNNPITIHTDGLQGHILRTGESILTPKVTDEMLEEGIKDKEHLKVIKKMNLRSSIIVPMKVGNKVTGTINFISTTDEREYNETDLNFAKDFATRIALALENARLHEEAQQEINERKKVEAALRESEVQFRSLSNAIPQLAWMADKDGWIFWYNERWFDYTGTTLEEMEGWGWEKVHHPEHKERIVELVKIAWKEGKPFELTFPLR